MSLPVARLEIITTHGPSKGLLYSKAKKVSKWAGERLGMKLIKFIGENGIECVGLAAPQVGIAERVFVLKSDAEYEDPNTGKIVVDFAIFVNPRVIEIGSMEDTKIESCLSIPGGKFNVTRPTSITVKDAIRTKPFELTDWVARAWLHELDHLNGKLICDTGIEVVEESTQKPL